MKKLNRIFGAGLVLILLASANIGNSQCRTFAKRKCIPTVEQDGFKFSGQMNNALLLNGEKADLALTFNSGKTYRLMVCSQPILGDVTFKLMDKDRTLIYDSEGKDKNYFDFNVESTQQLILEIIVPEMDISHGMLHDGCVSILQSYK